MRSKVVKKLILAQLCYFGCLLISIFINPGGFRNNHGLSFYGEHLQTLLPYGIGTIGCSWFLVQGAVHLPAQERVYRVLRIALGGMAALLVLLLLTPDNFGQFLNLSHEVVAFVLLVGELGLAAWLAFYWCRDVAVRLLLALQLAGGLVAMLSEFMVLQYLSAGTLVFQLSFCLLLVRALNLLLHEAPKPATASAEPREHYQTGTP